MKSTLLTLLLTACLGAQAQVKLSPLFSDNMVLQQQTAQVPIWGEAKAGSTVSVLTSWNGQTATTTADSSGRWRTTVSTPSAGGPYSITISDGKKQRVLQNVMIGEVWLCSGQSNMEMPVEGWGHIMNWQQEKAQADHPNIRLLFVEHTTAPQPITDLNVPAGGWQVCSPETVANFSACAYFFGRDIAQYQHVPVGLIDTSWGGTFVEPWTSAEALSTIPEQLPKLEEVARIPLDPAERDAAYAKLYDQWLTAINTLDRGFSGTTPTWALPQTDVSHWPTIHAPGYADEQTDEIRTFDGFLWVRHDVDLPASWKGKDLTLELGAIDDNDITYFNGQQVGTTIGCGNNRQYTVPAQAVKAGRNVIAIRIHDTGGLTGFVADEKSFVVRQGKDSRSIAGPWHYQLSIRSNDAPEMPRNINNDPNAHTVLFNAMIHPIVPYTIKGAIWYQGENNANQAYQYRELMPLMIHDWRQQWGYDFPFYQVQLANYMQRQAEPVESAWAELREAQLLTSQHLKGVGMATIIDIGEANDIHPKNKQEVGRRLALAARATAYGERVDFEGPQYRSYVIEGNKIRINFQPRTARGLTTSDGRPVKGFAIAGLDRRWHWAEATIETESHGRFQSETVVISSPEVPFPVAVRYAWADNPDCNLVNAAQLPATPFRTDDWPGITATNRR